MGWFKKLYWYVLGVVVGFCLAVYIVREDTQPDNINTDYEVAISIPVKDVFNVYIEQGYIGNKFNRVVIAEHNGVVISIKNCFTTAPILLPIEVDLCKQGLIKS